VRTVFERFYDKQQSPSRTAQLEKIQERAEKKDSVPVITESVFRKEPKITPSKVDFSLLADNDLWEKKVVKHHHQVVLAAIILIILAMAGNVLTKGKYLKMAIGHDKYQLIETALKEKIVWLEQR
jgi:hypothetical protein